jgi:F-type H+-transporting ATPase subunit epsilon
MARTLLLTIITPDAVIHEEQVDQVTIPTTEGEITVLPEHVALVTLMGKGDIVAVKDGEHIPFLVSGGFARIDGETVTIMADTAHHIDLIATAEAIAAAEQRAADLQHQFENEEDVDFEHFESGLEKELLIAKLGNKWKTRGYRK